MNPNIDEKYFEINLSLWEILINMEIHAENKMGLSNQIKKMLHLIENDFANNKNSICDIFNTTQLNNTYNKNIKISFILTTYIKFILLDFNFETTLKSNIKRLLSSVNENLLSILTSQVFVNDNIKENPLFSIFKIDENKKNKKEPKRSNKYIL